MLPTKLPYAVIAAMALAMAPVAQPERFAVGEGYELAPTRLPENGLIKVDGRFDEPGWAAAARLGRLTQVQPVQGLPPEKATLVRLAYDDDFLYLAMQCEEDPELVRARLMNRDANLDADDRIEFWIDTFDAQRFGYWFQIGAGGSLGDALLGEGGTRFNKSWDGIWYGISRVTPKGWQAEVALPFKTIGFAEGSTSWGFNLRRYRRAPGIELRWATPLQAYRFFDLSVGGELSNLRDIRQGVGLDVVPYARAGSSRDRREGEDTSVEGDFGLDLRYRLSPSLGLLLTYNTDFAETEVDDRQVNLTRFPLFFPEKRDFFLQDADLFEFGFSGSRAVVPFFSRRIGRAPTGDAVPILAGAKIAGRAGDWNVGALGTVVDEFFDGTEKEDARGLGVARVAYNLGEQSSVGAIVTSGRPSGSGSAATGGLDFRLADNEFFGPEHAATLRGYWVASQNEGQDDGSAWGVNASTRSRFWEHSGEAEVIDPGFAPLMGFVRRTGTRRVEWDSEYTWRGDGDGLRSVSLALSPELTTLTSGRKDSYNVSARLNVSFESQEEIRWRTTRRFDRVPEEFELRDGIAVQPGDYTDTRHRLSFETSNDRIVSVELAGEVGDFYSGNLTRTSIEPQFLPSRYLRLSGAYDVYQVRLNEGNFTTRVTEGRVDLTFTPLISWRNLMQYDTESKNMNVQTRFRWILEPGQDLFVVGVYGWGREDRMAPLVPTTQDLTVKLVYTIRF